MSYFLKNSDYIPYLSVKGSNEWRYFPDKLANRLVHPTIIIK